MSKKFVIAGNMGEFWDYANKPAVPNQELVYVDKPSILHNTTNPRGVFIGTWRERTDLFDIFNTLEVAWKFQNPAIRKIREQIVNASQNPLSVYMNGSLLAPSDYSISGKVVQVYNPTNELVTVDLKTADKLYYSHKLMPRDTLHVTLHIAIS